MKNKTKKRNWEISQAISLRCKIFCHRAWQELPDGEIDILGWKYTPALLEALLAVRSSRTVEPAEPQQMLRLAKMIKSPEKAVRAMARRELIRIRGKIQS